MNAPSTNMKSSSCFNCDKTDGEFPLVRLQFSGKDVLICPQCLPALIHHPEKLAEKIASL